MSGPGKVENAFQIVCDHLTKLERVFRPGTKLTFLARTPGNDEGDMLVTLDDLLEVEKAIARSRKRPEFTPGEPS